MEPRLSGAGKPGLMPCSCHAHASAGNPGNPIRFPLPLVQPALHACCHWLPLGGTARLYRWHAAGVLVFAFVLLTLGRWAFGALVAVGAAAHAGFGWFWGVCVAWAQCKHYWRVLLTETCYYYPTRSFSFPIPTRRRAAAPPFLRAGHPYQTFDATAAFLPSNTCRVSPG